MAIKVEFATLTGPFKRLRSEEFETCEAALAAVKAHCEPHGFINVKEVQDDPEGFEGWRYTARTPGGRGGRNVATGEFTDGPFPEGF